MSTDDLGTSSVSWAAASRSSGASTGTQSDFASSFVSSPSRRRLVRSASAVLSAESMLRYRYNVGSIPCGGYQDWVFTGSQIVRTLAPAADKSYCDWKDLLCEFPGRLLPVRCFHHLPVPASLPYPLRAAQCLLVWLPLLQYYLPKSSDGVGDVNKPPRGSQNSRASGV